jgi:peptidoglycan/xylan/chitin deacetylase (PgdA/CDA1 family)
MRELVKKGYKIATLEEAIGANSYEERVAVITFDDGRAGCFNYARTILSDLGIRACFYICPGFIDGNPPQHECYSRFMDWSQVRALAEEGHLIGSHSMTHCKMGEMSPDLLRAELDNSREEIDRHLRLPESRCRHFALPYGDGVLAVKDLAEECDYTTVVTTESTMNIHPFDHLSLARWSITSPCSAQQFSKDLTLLECGTLM